MQKESDLARHKVLVLVGGLGERLQSVYADGPKAMAPIHGTPFLAHLLARLEQADFEHVVLCVGYRHEQIQNWFGDGASAGLRISYSVEEELLGTGGAIRLGAERFAKGQRIFAMNGDTLHTIDFTAMLGFRQAHRAHCTVGLTSVAEAGRYGSVELDTSGVITAFREKNGTARGGLVNSGTYIVEPEVLEGIPEDRPVSLEREVLPQWLKNGLVGFSASGYFIDIGVPEDYLRAQQELKRLEAM
jgi:NDP-sugar pyrophosphorylase family protein